MFFNDNQIAKISKQKLQKFDRSNVVALALPERKFELFTEDELRAAAGSVLVFDTECYRNYFLVAFKSVELGKVIYFEKSADSKLDITKMGWIFFSFCCVGFNSKNYDMPMVWAAVAGASCSQLKTLSNKIILENLRADAAEELYEFSIPKTNHIDLIEVAPLSASLKTYAGRLHCQRMQDLPFSPEINLSKAQADEIKLYCINDLDNTELLYCDLKPQIKLREELSEKYDVDLRSKSDAQIAEAVIVSECTKILGVRPRRPRIEAGTAYKYQVPAYIKYHAPQLVAMLAAVKRADFIVSENGSFAMPPELDDLLIRMGSAVYKMGLGGLHSTEETIAHRCTDDTLLIDRDVASFYPRIILNLGLFPQHIGPEFLTIYDSLVERRLAAKKNGNAIEADSIKIVINGSFGKLGSMWSTLYSPDLMIQVTITGQLAILMLIEMVESVGVEVVSANTDGIVMKCPKQHYDKLNETINLWENLTAFQTEEGKYKALFSRDVNNYIVLKDDGKCKVKGTYSEKGSALNSVLSKNPEHLICQDAVINLISKNIPIEETIIKCKDIRRFVTVRNVKGGGEHDGCYLGKVVRFYYAKNYGGTINYIGSGNKVPNSDGARPLMDLPVELPTDIDYSKYIQIAIQMLYDIGYFKTSKSANLF